MIFNNECAVKTNNKILDNSLVKNGEIMLFTRKQQDLLVFRIFAWWYCHQGRTTVIWHPRVCHIDICIMEFRKFNQHKTSSELPLCSPKICKNVKKLSPTSCKPPQFCFHGSYGHAQRVQMGFLLFSCFVELGRAIFCFL